MKIVIACDSYKGSASTLEVAGSIEKGIRRIYKDADIIKLPIADGGEGTVDALVLGGKGKYEDLEVLGPLGKKVKAKYGVLDGNIGIIEMASASGITLLEEKDLNPLITTTYGTGQLIKSVIEKGIKKIYVGVGGSGTNDGGVGMAQALGISFKDKKGQEIGYGGGELNKIETIDFTNVNPALKDVEIMVISDVQNPLCGPNGASRVYGPQKGGTEEMIEILDSNLRHLGEKISEYLDLDIINIPGTGAAGGLGGGLIAFCKASIWSGIDKVLDIIEIDKYLLDADLVITGEGRIDDQSIYGKAPVGVAKRAKGYNLPVIAIVASVGDGAWEVYSHGIDLILDIIDKPMTLEYAMENVGDLLEGAGANAARAYMMNRSYIKDSL